jgi:hypothetical protein
MIQHSSEQTEESHEKSFKSASDPGKIWTGDLLNTNQEYYTNLLGE